MTIQLPNAVTTNINQFTGRTWLLPILLDWYLNGDQRLFLLTGGPGTGKSMIMAWLAGHGPVPTDTTGANHLHRLRNAVTAAHFCQATSRNRSPTAFSDNVARQLTVNVPGFGDALAATLADRVQITLNQHIGVAEPGATITNLIINRLDLGLLGDEASFDRAFSRPLQMLYAQGYNQPMLLLVDALDEAETYSGVKLAQLLAQLDDLPTLVRILATTRPDPRVLKLFRSSPSIDLARPGIVQSDDIQDFVHQQLEQASVTLTAAERTTLAQCISEASRGVFLYARLVLDELLPALPDTPNLANYPLPNGLSQLYHASFNRELGRDETYWHATMRPMLGLIAVARDRGLTASQLRQIAGAPVELPLRQCRQYLGGDLPEGPFLPFHRSLAEFLLEDEENIDYHIDAAEMHRKITDYYVSTYDQDWLHCDVYGLGNVIDHAIAASLPATENQVLFERILTDQFVAAVQRRMGWLYSLIEDLGALEAVEPELTASLCYALILDRPANSLVIQQTLQLLVKLSQQGQVVEATDQPDRAGLQRVVGILSGSSTDAPELLLERLTQESVPRLRGVIALALAETRNNEVTPILVDMLRQERGEGSWAAADALIALNDRKVIPELIQWYQAIQNKNDWKSSADKQRILYILGWMRAGEAEVLKATARTSPHYRVIGRGVDLCWQLPTVAADQIYLKEQLQRILDSLPQEPKTLGPWADEWLQKRLVRAIQHLQLIDLLPQLRELREHVQARPAPQSSTRKTLPWEQAVPKRERLLGSLEEAIAELA